MRLIAFSIATAAILVVLIAGPGPDMGVPSSKSGLETPPPPADPDALATTYSHPLPSDVFSRTTQSRVLDATVQVSSGGGHGTGTLIGRDAEGAYFLTADHVIDRGPPYGIDFQRGGLTFSQGIQIVERSKGADLALLRLRTQVALPPPVRVCPPGLKPVPPFHCFTIGCNTPAKSLQLTRVTDTHSIVSMSGDPWLIADPTAHGRSGGPLIDERGFLTGVCCKFGPDNRGVYQSNNEIYRLLDEAGKSDLYEGRPAYSLPAWDIVQVVVRLLLAWIAASWLERWRGQFTAEGRVGIPLMVLMQAFLLILIQGRLAHLDAQQSLVGVLLLLGVQVCWLIGIAHLCSWQWSGPMCAMVILLPPLALAFRPSSSVIMIVALAYYVPLAVRSWVTENRGTVS